MSYDKKYSKWIQSLFVLRESGDYDIRSDIDRRKAENALAMASEIVTVIKEYLNKL